MESMDSGKRNFTLRPARPEDLPVLVGLMKECIAAMRARGIDQWDDVYPGEPTLAKDIEDGALFAFEHDERIVGCAALNDVQEPEYASVRWSLDEEPVAVIHRLMIRPTDQGKGYARSFMGYLETRAGELGFKTIRLDAFAANPRAVGLYLNLGYRRAGMVKFRKGLFHCYEKSLPA